MSRQASRQTNTQANKRADQNFGNRRKTGKQASNREQPKQETTKPAARDKQTTANENKRNKPAAPDKQVSNNRQTDNN